MSKLILTMCDLLEKGENVIMTTVARNPGQALLAGGKKLARPELFPQADEVVVLNSFEKCFNGLEIPAESYVLVLAGGRRFEKMVVRQALATKAGYIGIIGSLRKRDALFRELMDTGFSIDDLMKISCPIGIDILAKTPPEIAVSIVAELILVLGRGVAAQNGQANSLTGFQSASAPAGFVGKAS